ncbi:MAG: GNAT family N-acetyltransferase, partial [Clostridiales bacterium]
MEFRLAEEKDTLAIKKLWSYSFESYQPYFDWYFHTIYSPQRTLGLWEKENLLASLQLAPYKMQIRGQALDCNYIVGVITSPACRGRHIGWQLMQEALAYLQKNSLPLAVLKPAASDFYYKLGFSFCYEDIIWKMPLLSIKNLLPPKNEALIQWQAIDIIDIPQNIIFLDQIFQGMNQNPAHKLNGYILRNQMNWQNYLEEHLGDGCRCWLMKRNGLPAAYLLFLLKDKQFQLREMAFIDFQAQKEAFAFIYGHQNEAENFIWTAPSWDKSYLQLTYQNGLALHPSKMGKIIHIPQTLSLISYPA